MSIQPIIKTSSKKNIKLIQSTSINSNDYNIKVLTNKFKDFKAANFDPTQQINLTHTPISLTSSGDIIYSKNIIMTNDNNTGLITANDISLNNNIITLSKEGKIKTKDLDVGNFDDTLKEGRIRCKTLNINDNFIIDNNELNAESYSIKVNTIGCQLLNIGDHAFFYDGNFNCNNIKTNSLHINNGLEDTFTATPDYLGFSKNVKLLSDPVDDNDLINVKYANEHFFNTNNTITYNDKLTSIITNGTYQYNQNITSNYNQNINKYNIENKEINNNELFICTNILYENQHIYYASANKNYIIDEDTNTSSYSLKNLLNVDNINEIFICNSDIVIYNKLNNNFVYLYYFNNSTNYQLFYNENNDNIPIINLIKVLYCNDTYILLCQNEDLTTYNIYYLYNSPNPDNIIFNLLIIDNNIKNIIVDYKQDNKFLYIVTNDIIYLYDLTNINDALLSITIEQNIEINYNIISCYANNNILYVITLNYVIIYKIYSNDLKYDYSLLYIYKLNNQLSINTELSCDLCKNIFYFCDKTNNLIYCINNNLIDVLNINTNLIYTINNELYTNNIKSTNNLELYIINDKQTYNISECILNNNITEFIHNIDGYIYSYYESNNEIIINKEQYNLLNQENITSIISKYNTLHNNIYKHKLCNDTGGNIYYYIHITEDNAINTYLYKYDISTKQIKYIKLINICAGNICIINNKLYCCYYTSLENVYYYNIIIVNNLNDFNIYETVSIENNNNSNILYIVSEYTNNYYYNIISTNSNIYLLLFDININLIFLINLKEINDNYKKYQCVIDNYNNLYLFTNINTNNVILSLYKLNTNDNTDITIDYINDFNLNILNNTTINYALMINDKIYMSLTNNNKQYIITFIPYLSYIEYLYKTPSTLDIDTNIIQCMTYGNDGLLYCYKSNKIITIDINKHKNILSQDIFNYDNSLIITQDYIYSHKQIKTPEQIINTTIIHNMPVIGDINNYKIGLPVFISNNGLVTKLQKNEIGEYTYIKITKDNFMNNTTNLVPYIQLEDNNNFIGIISAVYKANNLVQNNIIINQPTIDISTHGDYLFKTDRTIEHYTTSRFKRLYKIGDEILYNGDIIDNNEQINNNILKNSVGIITGFIDDVYDYVSVFKK